MRLRLALLCGVLLLGAALLEGVARHLCRTDEARRERLLWGDAYWIDRWLADEAPLDGADGINRYDERLGWVPRENLHRADVSISSLGIRGAREVTLAKAAGEKRIVVVGDSFTFGEGVQDEEVWTERLAARLPGVTVLNLGVLGYGLDQQCLRLEELGMELQPDLVLVGLFGPDFDRNELTVRDAPKPRFVLTGTGLELENVPVPTAEQLRARVEREPIGSYAWALFRKLAATRSAEARGSVRWELGRRILDRMREAAERGGARLAVAYFPAKAASFDRDADVYERTAVEWAASRRMPLVNVRDAFVELGSDRFKEVWHGHWTPFGNEVVAEAVHQGLLRLRVLPLPR